MTNAGILAIVFLVMMLAVLTFGVFHNNYRLDRLECQEDMACWDCETMGNKICGGK